MNPFDEFPIPRNMPTMALNASQAMIIETSRWRKKWELTIVDAMKKAEFLDWFCELGEANRAMMAECLEEYLEEVKE